MAQARLELVRWNADKLLARSTQILEQFAPVIAEEARQQIVSPIWEWPNPTLRFKSLYQGGERVKTKFGSAVLIPAGKRDIVDRGQLLNSQQAPQVANNSLSIEWTAPYSGVVLRGGNYGSYVNPAGKPTDVGDRPPRNWIEAALRKQPPLPFFVAQWKQLAS